MINRAPRLAEFCAAILDAHVEGVLHLVAGRLFEVCFHGLDYDDAIDNGGEYGDCEQRL